MNEKLMPVAKAILQTIKRVLWGTYCGFRQCVLLLFIFALTNSDWMIPEIGVMILLSLSYAVFYHWVTAFTKQSSMLKKCVISYIPYMVTMLAYIYYGEYANEFNIRPTVLSIIYSVFEQILLVTFAPIFPIALTALELFVKERLQGRWHRIVKWIYNVIASLPIVAIVAVAAYFFGIDYMRRYRFDDSDTIERITGAPCPDFKVVEYEMGSSSFNGDYDDCLIVEFEQIPTKEFYQVLDSLVKAEGSYWNCNDGEYHYSRMWGNGMPAPEGEDDEEDMSLSFTMKKGENRAKIRYGAW